MPHKLLLLILLFSVACTNANKVQDRFPARSKNTSPNMNCKEYFGLLKTVRPATIKDALRIVKTERPRFLDNYAVAYDSQSLHGSSFKYPRALAYGGDAKMILTFNGSPKQDGYERLEVMCFNDHNDTFEFRDIAFPKEAKNPEVLDDIPEELHDEPYVLSPPNGHPERNCKACHGTPVRPNWDTYNFWPGICSKHFPNSHINYTDTIGKKCDQFEKNRGNDDRYSLLGKGNDGPAFRLGQQLALLNAKRIGSELERRKDDLKSVKYRIAEALYCSLTVPFEAKKLGLPVFIDLAGLAPKPVSPRVRELLIDNMKSHASKLARMEDLIGKDKVSYKDTLTNKQGVTFLKNYYGIQPKNHREEAGLYDAARTVQETIALANLEKVLQPFGINVKNWSMTLHGGFGHENGGLDVPIGQVEMPGYLGREYARKLLKNEKRIQEIYNLCEKDFVKHDSPCYFDKMRGLRNEMCNIVKPKAENERQRYGIGTQIKGEQPVSTSE